MKHIGSTTAKERAKALGTTAWLFEKNNFGSVSYYYYQIEDYKGFYYCTHCNKTWEYQDGVLFHHKLPTFKVKQKICSTCKRREK